MLFFGLLYNSKWHLILIENGSDDFRLTPSPIFKTPDLK
jgi:hypothetical protein